MAKRRLVGSGRGGGGELDTVCAGYRLDFLNPCAQVVRGRPDKGLGALAGWPMENGAASLFEGLGAVAGWPKENSAASLFRRRGFFAGVGDTLFMGNGSSGGRRVNGRRLSDRLLEGVEVEKRIIVPWVVLVRLHWHCASQFRLLPRCAADLRESQS